MNEDSVTKCVGKGGKIFLGNKLILKWNTLAYKILFGLFYFVQHLIKVLDERTTWISSALQKNCDKIGLDWNVCNKLLLFFQFNLIKTRQLNATRYILEFYGLL